MKDEDKSQAQLIEELQLLRNHLKDYKQNQTRYIQFLDECEELMTEHFDIYYHAHDMVVSIDMESEKVLWCNRAVMKALGYSRAEIVGHPTFKLYHQNCVEDAKKLFRVIAETGEIHDAEQTLRKRDGGTINVSLNATTVRDENGNPTEARFDWRDTTRHAGEIDGLRAENRQLKQRLSSNRPQNPEVFSEIITQDPEMYSIFSQVESMAGSSNPMLITGETGVGKEKIAAIVHKLSGRRGEFVPVNIAGVDDMLFSDTLFGHEKGAHTGADSARHGLVEQASGGTLFLDEIGDLGTESQTKLLRFLQEGEYRHLGEDTPII
ncbi:MAG: sigma 54-interacting transcriptional regulator, partial [Candidatus Poribacteria bacterium]|nr:sigma 54-interacting transcriptional regulator [Candidatus Poribacteria bacterium]